MPKHEKPQTITYHLKDDKYDNYPKLSFNYKQF